MKHYLIKSIIRMTLVIVTPSIYACTTAIISGKYTIDGRPLLFKQRDTNSLENKVMSFSDGKYNYVGIVNAQDSIGKEVWGGHNSAGFAIMNSASYNLNPPSKEKRDEKEGELMKKALQTCATLADFEKLLESLPKPMFISANFGVIDAQGGAAYYETGDYGYVKFDANDKNTSPMGYIIRTNFSFSGNRNEDKGLSRFQTASDLFYKAALSNTLSYQFILEQVSRSLTHGITGTNLYNQLPQDPDTPLFVAFRDYIPRYLTASTIVVQGIKENESPELTTMWTILGSPLTSVTIPVWVTKPNTLPTILTADKTGKAPLCSWTLEVKKQLFPITNGEGPDYINLAALISADQKGILQRARPVEKKIFLSSEEVLNRWRNKNKISNDELITFYKQISTDVTALYKN